MSRNQTTLNRRDFLKFTGVVSATLLLPAKWSNNLELVYPQGRVIPESIQIHSEPDVNSPVVKLYWNDSIHNITGVDLSDDTEAFNRVWYQMNSEGYAYSGHIQPVATNLMDENIDLPDGGSLAEVTVPYTDARWKPDPQERVAYRFYFETTHWVIGKEMDEQGNLWYQILDDKWDLILYVWANHIRIITPDELQQISGDIPLEDKRIEVRTPEQLVIAYEYNRPVFTARVATGAKFSNGTFSTPLGTHYTYHKRPSRHMAAGNLAYNGYDLPGVPWVSYITERGVAFHGTYWHNDYGHPRSHGCINLTPQAAKWIYLWTSPQVPPHEQRTYDETGTRVDVI